MRQAFPLIVAGLGIGAGIALLMPPSPAFTTDGEEEQTQAPDRIAPVFALIDSMTADTNSQQAQANIAAGLRAIRWAEGTAGPNGYRTLFGGKLFTSYADHPRLAQRFTDRAGRQLWTTAAGAYQFLAVSPIPGRLGVFTTVNTWDRIKARLGLPDFSPESQDAAAVELIREAGALGDLAAGRFFEFARKVRRIWASLPDAGYDQPTRRMEDLQAAYIQAGGALA